MIMRLFRRDPRELRLDRLYADIVTASRVPRLYADLAVPDTLEGRFESLSLHVSLVQSRLKELGAPAVPVAQGLINRLFADLDSSLREIGIGDTSVPKKMKLLGEAFYGRAAAYDAVTAGKADAGEVLARNVLELGDGQGEDPRAVALAQYMAEALAILRSKDLDAILADNAPPFEP